MSWTWNGLLAAAAFLWLMDQLASPRLVPGHCPAEQRRTCMHMQIHLGLIHVHYHLHRSCCVPQWLSSVVAQDTDHCFALHWHAILF